MSIKKQLQANIKEAMKAKQSDTLIVLRGFNAAIKQKEIDERIELTDEQVLAVLDKKIKQSRDSIKQFADADRKDLVKKEEFDIDTLSQFLPKQLTKKEIEAIIEQALLNSEQKGMAAMGEVMRVIKPQLQGRADMKVVSQIVKDKI